MKIKLILIVAAICFTAFVLVNEVKSASTTNIVVRDPNNIPAKHGANCDISTVTAVQIGAANTDKTIIATSSTRAWARIQVGNNATNTVFLAFDSDKAATLNNGIALNAANTNGASSTPFIEFGLTTDFPYIGAVHAVTNYGGAPVLVTTCNY